MTQTNNWEQEYENLLVKMGDQWANKEREAQMIVRIFIKEQRTLAKEEERKRIVEIATSCLKKGFTMDDFYDGKDEWRWNR